MRYLIIRHYDTSRSGKTGTYEVRNTRDKDALGLIVYRPGWRKYVFAPYELTIWDTACLREIAESIDGLMAKRRAKQKKEKGGTDEQKNVIAGIR